MYVVAVLGFIVLIILFNPSLIQSRMHSTAAKEHIHNTSDQGTKHSLPWFLVQDHIYLSSLAWKKTWHNRDQPPHKPKDLQGYHILVRTGRMITNVSPRKSSDSIVAFLERPRISSLSSKQLCPMPRQITFSTTTMILSCIADM